MQLTVFDHRWLYLHFTEGHICEMKCVKFDYAHTFSFSNFGAERKYIFNTFIDLRKLTRNLGKCELCLKIPTLIIENFAICG